MIANIKSTLYFKAFGQKKAFITISLIFQGKKGAL